MKSINSVRHSEETMKKIVLLLFAFTVYAGWDIGAYHDGGWDIGAYQHAEGVVGIAKLDSIVPCYSWVDSSFNIYTQNWTDSAKSFCKANSVNLSCIDFGNPKRYKLPLWTPPGLYWLKIGTIEDTDSTVTDSLRVRVLKFEVLDGSEQ